METKTRKAQNFLLGGESAPCGVGQLPRPGIRDRLWDEVGRPLQPHHLLCRLAGSGSQDQWAAGAWGAPSRGLTGAADQPLNAQCATRAAHVPLNPRPTPLANGPRADVPGRPGAAGEERICPAVLLALSEGWSGHIPSSGTRQGGPRGLMLQTASSGADSPARAPAAQSCSFWRLWWFPWKQYQPPEINQ